MQMDWLRYWTLAKPNDKSINAPVTDEGTLHLPLTACAVVRPDARRAR